MRHQLLILIGMGVIVSMSVLKAANLIPPKEQPRLRVGFPHYWGSLIPPLQHTAYGDFLIKNQFEPLVTTSHDGHIVPLAAKSWVLSEDRKTLTFKINTTRRFSNGKFLSARDFKASWEYALGLVPKSANNSLLDLLYKVDGFETFEKTAQLSGLITPNDETLIIRFSTPFRMSLEHLSGGRFAAFVREGEKYLGTGRYVLEENGKKSKVLLDRNPYSSLRVPYEKIEVLHIERAKAIEALTSNEIDAYAEADHQLYAACEEPSSSISCVTGNESSHTNIVVNGLSGRLFSHPPHRLALQSLVQKEIRKNAHPKFYDSALFKWDPQFYLPIEAGRLESEEVEKLIASGERFIPALLTAAKKHPIYFVCTEESQFLITLLKSLNLTIDARSGVRDFKSRVSMYYKTHEPDLMVLSHSVAGGDPDSLYHALGEHGAITSPMLYRKPVADLLEQGRKLTEPTKIHAHYQNVSRAILRSVPVVHLGFILNAMLYRSDRIKVSTALMNREELGLEIFEPK